MRYRPLGKTGLTVSEIGFGAWGIGGNSGDAVAYGPTDDAQSIRAVRRAFDLGVTFFDTADLYGFGHSEQVLARAIGDVRSQVVLASKAGMVSCDGRQDFSRKHLTTAIERTLDRLQTDYLDLYQLHSPAVDCLVRDREPLEVLESLRAAGKIRAWGISVRSPDEGLLALDSFEAPCLQVNFNLVDQRALAGGLLARCESDGVGVIARTPLCFGFLTGRYTASDAFDATDHRRRWSPEQIMRWTEACRLFADALTARTSQTHAQIALRFCLSHRGISTTIPGMLAESHVEENVPASDFGPLPDEDLASLAQVYTQNVFFMKPK